MSALAYFSCVILIAAQPQHGKVNSSLKKDNEWDSWGDDDWGDDDWGDKALEPSEPASTSLPPKPSKNLFAKNKPISKPGSGWSDIPQQAKTKSIQSQNHHDYSAAYNNPVSIITHSPKYNKSFNTTSSKTSNDYSNTLPTPDKPQTGFKPPTPMYKSPRPMYKSKNSNNDDIFKFINNLPHNSSQSEDQSTNSSQSDYNSTNSTTKLTPTNITGNHIIEWRDDANINNLSSISNTSNKNSHLTIDSGGGDNIKNSNSSLTKTSDKISHTDKSGSNFTSSSTKPTTLNKNSNHTNESDDGDDLKNSSSNSTKTSDNSLIQAGTVNKNNNHTNNIEDGKATTTSENAKPANEIDSGKIHDYHSEKHNEGMAFLSSFRDSFMAKQGEEEDEEEEEDDDEEDDDSSEEDDDYEEEEEEYGSDYSEKSSKEYLSGMQKNHTDNTTLLVEKKVKGTGGKDVGTYSMYNYDG